MYCLRTLNNVTVGARRLIIDFALEDQRKLLKRERRAAHARALNKSSTDPKDLKGHKDAKDHKDKKDLKDSKKDNEKKGTSARKLSDIQSPEELKSMLKTCKSRGKKQRIKKKLVQMKCLEPNEKPRPTKEPKLEPRPEPVAEERQSLAGKRSNMEIRELEKDIVKARREKRKKKRTESLVTSDKFEVLHHS